MTKKVKLSGFCDATFHCGYDDEPTEGFIVQINGKNYAAYRDPDDGFRSYGAFFETEEACSNTFPPQEVIMEEIDKEGNYWPDEGEEAKPKQKGIILKNPETGETILEVTTTWWDEFYPVGHCSWSPENLPINKSRFEGATMTIIAEWYRECGDHVVIGKIGNDYIEGIVSKEGLQFGPIKDFNIINKIN